MIVALSGLFSYLCFYCAQSLISDQTNDRDTSYFYVFKKYENQFIRDKADNYDTPLYFEPPLSRLEKRPLLKGYVEIC